MQFYSLGNDQTFLFFEWLTRTQCVDVDGLIADAFERIDRNEFHEMGQDVSTSALDELTKILEFMIEPGGELLSEPEFMPFLGNGSRMDLFASLLLQAVDSIDAKRVAQALLIRARKWSPDTDIPDAI